MQRSTRRSPIYVPGVQLGRGADDSVMTILSSADRRFSDSHLVEVGFRAFLRIADLWQLTTAERMALLGLTRRFTYSRWLITGRPRAKPDLLQRLSFVAGIYADLRILYRVDEHAHTWVRRPNAGYPFGGKSPIEYIASAEIPALYETRRTLSAERYGRR